MHELVRAGHEVIIERAAGEGSSISDDAYVAAGARILPAADEVWAGAELVLKVKEPIPAEYERMRPGRCCSPTCTWPPIARSPKNC